MLKVVVIDSGYGGEFFADRFEDAVGVVEVIRVIDWRHDEQYLTSPRAARALATAALRPYIGKVDLIIFANHLLSLTSLKYFRRKYPKQQFVGLNLKKPDSFTKKHTLILTTKALAKTIEYRGFLFCLKGKVRTMSVDSWVAKIDDGELSDQEIDDVFRLFSLKKHIEPEEIILGNAQLEDIKPSLKRLFGQNLKIYSSFDDTIREACKVLRIRGAVMVKKK